MKEKKARGELQAGFFMFTIIIQQRSVEERFKFKQNTTIITLCKKIYIYLKN